MNTNEQFREMAEEVFGDSCARAVGRLLDVNHRTVQRWLSGEFEIPDEHFQALKRHHAVFVSVYPGFAAVALPFAEDLAPEIFTAMLEKVDDANKSKD